MRRFRVVVMIGLLCVAGVGVYGQDSLNVRRVGEVRYWDIAVTSITYDSLVLVATRSSGLRVLQMSDEANPIEIGIFDTPGLVQDIATDGHYAYIADGEAGLRIIDMLDPRQPLELSLLPLSEEVIAVDAQMGIACIALGTDGVRIVDVTDPASPEVVGSWDSTGTASDVVLRWPHLYVAHGISGLEVLDVSQPSNPIRVGQLLLLERAVTKLAYDNGAIYAALEERGFSKISIVDPARPRQVQTFDIGYCSDLAVADSIAYIAAGISGYYVVELFNTDFTTYYELPGYCCSITLRDNLALISARETGLHVIDAQDPRQAHEIGAYENYGRATSLAKTGDLLLSANSYGGLQIIDVFDFDHPNVLAEYNPELYSSRVDVQFPMACVVNGGYTHIINLTEPLNPQWVGNIDNEHYAQVLAMMGNRVYLGEDNIFSLVDIRNPAQPVETGRIEFSHMITDFAVSGNFVYCTLQSSELHIIEIVNSVEPVAVGNIQIDRDARAVSVSGRFLGIAAGASGVLFYDVTDPREPLALGTYRRFGQSAAEISIVGTTAFVADELLGLYVLDIQNPDAPVEIGYHTMVDQPRDILVEDAIVYVADRYYTRIYDCSDCVGLTPTRPGLIQNFALHSVFPNPFNSTTTITLDLPSRLRGRLVAYDALGREVRTLIEGTLQAGAHDIKFNGAGLSTGNYFVRFESPQFSAVQKAVLVK